MDRCTGHRDITETILGEAFNNIQSIITISLIQDLYHLHIDGWVQHYP